MSDRFQGSCKTNKSTLVFKVVGWDMGLNNPLLQEKKLTLQILKLCYLHGNQLRQPTRHTDITKCTNSGDQGLGGGTARCEPMEEVLRQSIPQLAVAAEQDKDFDFQLLFSCTSQFKGAMLTHQLNFLCARATHPDLLLLSLQRSLHNH